MGKTKKARYEKNELISFLQWYYDKYQHVPKTRELDSCSDYPSAGVFRRVFGSLDNAITEANITNAEYRKYYTDEELLNSIHRYVNDFNKIPTVGGMDNAKGYPSTSTYTKRFGNLRNAVIAAEIEIPDDAARMYEKEELLGYLRT
ncbi:hypothetical protein NXY55_23580, partial [Aeromonas veronii]|nr:hypothetical protein [Aeromonas veronii]